MISPSQFATIGQFKQTTDFVDSLISCLDAPAVGELMSGYEKDVDEVLRIIYEESQKVLFESKLTPSGSLGHIPYVSKIFEDTACSASLPYFITTHLPDFDMEEFHIEWSIITQMYLRTSVLAARGIGKSIFFSKAVPLWRMYRYRKGTPLNPVSRDIELCRDGLLVSNEYSLARELLGIVRKEIEENDSLRERLYPDNRENWGKDSIITQNGARLQVKSVGSRIRGLHPTYVIGDDLLDDSCLYSVDQNNKFINFFHSVLQNAIVPDGNFNVVGCVAGETIIATENGLRQIKDIVNCHEKGLIPNKLNVYGKEGWDETSHFWCNGLTTTNKLKLDYGLELECSEIHPLWKMTDDGPQWTQSQELKVGDWIGIRGGGIDFQQKPIPLNLSFKRQGKQELNWPEYVNEELAYLIGLYVSEGCISKNGRLITITCGDTEVHQKLKNNTIGLNWLCCDNEGLRYDCHSTEFIEILRSLGCDTDGALNKKIPDKIFECTDRQVLRGFLQGLFDGDGCSSLLQGKYLQVSLGSISETLIKQTQQILWNHFGILSGVTQRRTLGKSYIATGKHFVWTCSMTSTNAELYLDRVGFGLTRKQNPGRRELTTNKGDCIPLQKSLIRRLQQAKRKPESPPLPPRLMSAPSMESIGRKNYQSFIDLYNDSEAKQQAQFLIDSDIQWVKIKSIEKGECITYDFVIPKTNSFIGNGIINHNTPFRSGDLYDNLAQSDVWRCFSYPLINPRGEILSRRFTMGMIDEKLKSQGSIIFSREILVKPITSNSTLFPYSLTSLAKRGMEKFRLVNNVQSFPVPLVEIGVGVDIATSANVGADYFVVAVIGKDDIGRYWLLHITRKQGASLNEQLGVIKRVQRDFGGRTVIESNAAQTLLVDAAIADGLHVIADPTTTNKYSPKTGLIGVSVLFERNLMKFPYGDEYSRNMVDLVLDEFSSITWTDKGLKNIGTHDDTCMAIYKAIRGCNYSGGEFRASFW